MSGQVCLLLQPVVLHLPVVHLLLCLTQLLQTLTQSPLQTKHSLIRGSFQSDLLLQRDHLCLKDLFVILYLLFFYLHLRDGNGEFLILCEDSIEPIR